MQHANYRPGSCVFGYVRVSGREQATEGTSLDGQRERIARHCAQHALPPPDIRLEVESAGEEKIERRAELHRLIADARPGDLILVAMLDRWSRDIVFGVGSIRSLVRRGVGWCALYEQIDAATAHGDEQLGLRMWFAESERRRIRERTEGRRRELRAAGLWANGQVPYGYVRGDRTRRQHLHLSIDPARAAVVREAYARLIDGQSVRTVTAWMAAQGGPRHVAATHRVLRGRVYLGEMRAPGGEWIRGAHEPLITLDTWERAQEAMRSRRCAGRQPRGERTADLLLRGVLRCGLCGRKCGVDFGRFDHRYYVCGRRRHARDEGMCPGPYLRTDRADAEATAACLVRIGELREALLRGGEERAPTTPAEDLAAARAAAERRLARAVALAVDGAITAGELAEQRARVMAELGRIAVEEGERARLAAARAPGVAERLGEALSDIARTWGGMLPAERREAVGILARRVVVGEGGALAWEWRSADEMGAAVCG